MYKKTILKNGIRLITIPMASSKTATILVFIGTGSKRERKETSGISHFLEHMFFKGTTARPTALAVSEVLDRVGGAYNAFTGKEYTGFWAKVSPEHLDLAMDWMSDILLHSKFESAEIEKERGVILQEINMVQDTPMRYVEDLWENLLYGDQPAGWDILGTRETVKKISKKQIFEYFKNNYRGENIVICVAGKIGEKEEKKICDFFRGFRKGEMPAWQTTREIQTKPEVLCHFKETDQTHLCLGVRAYDLFHPDKYALGLLATILGGLMSSRLFISVREKRGLAYYIRTFTENYADSGYFLTQAGVGNKKVFEAVKAILKEYKKTKEQKISAKEINKAKDNFKGAMNLHLETSDEIASYAATQEITKKEILTPEEIIGKIEAVKADDLQRVANDVFQPAKLNLALIGPFKEKEKFERILEI